MFTNNWVTTTLSSCLVASTVVVATIGETHAQTLVQSWQIEDALSDSYHGANHNHAFWLQGFDGGNDFLIDGLSKFNVYDDGSASFVGSIVSENKPEYKFDFNLSFVADQWKPKKELKSSAYSSVVDVTTWQYFSLTGDASLQGAGALDGYTLDLVQRGAPNYGFQFGEGANGKNIQMGLSGWFNWELRDGQQTLVDYGKGDINVTAKTPEPASTLLISSLVLGGGSALKRKLGRKSEH